LKTRDRRDDNVERNIPCGGVMGGRGYVDIIASSKLEELANFETALSDDCVILFLACVETSEIGLSLRVGCEFSQNTKNLPAGDSTDVNIVS
jgi:hypothetical protein